jgi:glycine cleavage system H lipoate-binding protein
MAMLPDPTPNVFPNYVYGRLEPNVISDEYTRNEQVAVGITALEVSFAKKRKVILIQNISPNVTDIVYVSLNSKVATATNGIRLLQNESVMMTQDVGYTPYGGVVTAVCATATGVLNIFEQ